MVKYFFMILFSFDIYNYKLILHYPSKFMFRNFNLLWFPLESLQLDNFWLDKLKAVELYYSGCFGISSVETPCQNLHIFSSVGDKKALFNERDKVKILAKIK